MKPSAGLSNLVRLSLFKAKRKRKDRWGSKTKRKNWNETKRNEAKNGLLFSLEHAQTKRKRKQYEMDLVSLRSEKIFWVQCTESTKSLLRFRKKGRAYTKDSESVLNLRMYLQYVLCYLAQNSDSLQCCIAVRHDLLCIITLSQLRTILHSTELIDSTSDLARLAINVVFVFLPFTKFFPP
jgi:hypothetical protein